MKNRTFGQLAGIVAVTSSLLLGACASTSSREVASDAQPSLGKITQKQTIQQYDRHSSPVDVNVGVGGGSRDFGWGFSFGLLQIIRWAQLSSADVVYRYTVETAPNQSFVLQSYEGQFNINDCVTLWQRPNDSSYPRIQASSQCDPSANKGAAVSNSSKTDSSNTTPTTPALSTKKRR